MTLTSSRPSRTGRSLVSLIVAMPCANRTERPAPVGIVTWRVGTIIALARGFWLITSPLLGPQRTEVARVPPGAHGVIAGHVLTVRYARPAGVVHVLIQGHDGALGGLLMRGRRSSRTVRYTPGWGRSTFVPWPRPGSIPLTPGPGRGHARRLWEPCVSTRPHSRLRGGRRRRSTTRVPSRARPGFLDRNPRCPRCDSWPRLPGTRRAGTCRRTRPSWRGCSRVAARRRGGE